MRWICRFFGHRRIMRYSSESEWYPVCNRCEHRW